MHWHLLIVLVGLCGSAAESEGSTSRSTIGGKGCSEACLKCGPKGCIKCPSLITFPSRRCVNTCPYAHAPSWSTLHDYMGRICLHNGNLLGLSPQTTTVLAGLLCGALLCALLLAALLYIRLKRRRRLPQSLETGSELDDSPERRDFVKQLETLRPHAQTFLDMLNDTRRQLRELHRAGDNSALAAYKPVVRDLAKILLLLNHQVDGVAVPDDWEHLFKWAEKTLKRYKRMSDISQPQVAQLIDFLQGPVLSAQDAEVRTGTLMSTFKPDQVFGSSLSLQSAAIKNFNCNYELNPQWKFEYAPVGAAPTSEFNPVVWKNSKEFLHSALFLDDDFCQLGFRPQDEITTEL